MVVMWLVLGVFGKLFLVQGLPYILMHFLLTVWTFYECFSTPDF